MGFENNQHFHRLYIILSVLILWQPFLPLLRRMEMERTIKFVSYKIRLWEKGIRSSIYGWRRIKFKFAIIFLQNFEQRLWHSMIILFWSQLVTYIYESNDKFFVSLLVIIIYCVFIRSINHNYQNQKYTIISINSTKNCIKFN